MQKERKRTRRHAQGGGESKVTQSDRDRTDVNLILRKYLATGTLEGHNPRVAQYGDFSSGDDFHTISNRVRAAQEKFNLLPAKVRSFCNNDLAQWVDLISDPENEENVETLRFLGMIDDLVPDPEPEKKAPVPEPKTPEPVKVEGEK